VSSLLVRHCVWHSNACWSLRLARSHYCQQLTLSVCPSVCHAPSNCFFFVSRWNRAIFWPLFFNFWFRPPNAQNLLPKISTKSPVSRLVRQIDRRCVGLPGGFRGWPIQRNHAKCSGADPWGHDNEIWARRWDPVAYRLVLLLFLLLLHIWVL